MLSLYIYRVCYVIQLSAQPNLQLQLQYKEKKLYFLQFSFILDAVLNASAVLCVKICGVIEIEAISFRFL